VLLEEGEVVGDKDQRPVLVRDPRPKLDRLDAYRSRLVGLVSIPRLDDRLGLFSSGQELDGFIS
jgi:hypothetical protein